MTAIAAKKVALIHYTLTDGEGTEIDTSRGSEPMPYLHGSDNIVPGLEAQLEGKKAGEKIKAVVAPEDGYGPKSGAAAQDVPRSAFEGANPEPGMPVSAEDEEGNHMQLWIVEVTKDKVTITPDHPLAGVTLHFDVEVMEVRDATDSELEHGHPHSGDGQHH
ncbi:MAG: peptidylprolyl isomerase [Myxococcota bacterium]